jgi:hypothetical protein
MGLFQTEGARPFEALLSEAEGRRSREEVTVLAGAALAPNTVVGRITKGAVTSAVKSSGPNTGNGVLTVNAGAPRLVNCVPGVYTARCIAAAVNGGTFRVTAPDGTVLGDVAVGATFANRIQFAIADGAADFSVGDGFDITVAAGSGKVAQFNPTATDGREIAYGVLLYPANSATADDHVAAIVRDAELEANLIIWPTGISGPNKAAGIAALEARGIIVR